MALSLGAHAVLLLPLMLAGAPSATPSDEPALMVEYALAAPAPASAAEATIQPAAEPEPEFALDLPPPEEPPPPKLTEFKPPEQPKQRQAAARPTPPASAKPTAQPDQGTTQVTQASMAAAAPAPLPIVWEGKPRFRHPPTPAPYPPRALELGQQGEAVVRVRLDPDGSAAEILLSRGTGFDLLDRAALHAVRGWHFLPAMRDGRAVAAWVEIPVRFQFR